MKNSSSHGKELVSGTVISVIAAIILGVVNYFTRRILALDLSKEDFGFFYSAYSMVLVLLILVDFGTGHTLAVIVPRHLSDGRRDRIAGMFIAVFAFEAVMSTLVVLGLFWASEFLCESYFCLPRALPSFRVLIMLIWATSLLGSVLALFLGLKDQISRNLISILQGVLVLGITALMLPSFGVIAPAWGYVGGAVICLLVSGGRLFFKYPHLLKGGRGAFRGGLASWRLTIWLGISGPSLTLLGQCDTQMLTWLVGLESVSTYNIALPILQIFMVLLVIPQVFIPISAELWHQDRKADLQDLFELVVGMLIILGSGIAVLLFCEAPVLISVLFSHTHLDAGPVLSALGIGLVFLFLSQFCMMLLNAIHRHRRVASLVLVGVVVNIVLNFLLIRRLGAVGAAVATSLTHCFLFFGSYAMVKKSLQFKVPWTLVFLVLGALASCYVCKNYLIKDQFPIMIENLICELIYLAFVGWPLFQIIQKTRHFYRPETT